MNASTAIAKLLFDKGIRLLSGEAGALHRVEDGNLKNQIVTVYRVAMNDDVEITVNLRQLPDFFHNAYQLLYNNCFEQIELGRISDEIDFELFSLQTQERREQRDEADIHSSRIRAEAA